MKDACTVFLADNPGTTDRQASRWTLAIADEGHAKGEGKILSIEDQLVLPIRTSRTRSGITASTFVKLAHATHSCLWPLAVERCSTALWGTADANGAPTTAAVDPNRNKTHLDHPRHFIWRSYKQADASQLTALKSIRSAVGESCHCTAAWRWVDFAWRIETRPRQENENPVMAGPYRRARNARTNYTEPHMICLWSDSQMSLLVIH